MVFIPVRPVHGRAKVSATVAFTLLFSFPHLATYARIVFAIWINEDGQTAIVSSGGPATHHISAPVESFRQRVPSPPYHRKQ